MKNIKTIIATLLIGALAACSPSEKRYELPEAIDKSQLKFAVTQKQGDDNVVYLASLTPNTIPFWNYGEGTSTLANDTLILPFSGDYMITYGVSSKGGYVQGDSVKITVTNTDLSSITDPQWKYLTNGEAGKTWALDMTKPIGWYGLDFGKGSGDDWSWHPDYAGNEWVMPKQDYGSMTFDLNNGKNYKRILKDANGVPTTTTGKFAMDVPSKKIKLIGAEMLFGGSYYANVSNWSDLKILYMDDTTMTLGVLRDKPNPGDGVCYIGFTFIVKP